MAKRKVSVDFPEEYRLYSVNGENFDYIDTFDSLAEVRECLKDCASDMGYDEDPRTYIITKSIPFIKVEMKSQPKPAAKIVETKL